jgi:heme exporter protein CcmD
MGSLTEYLDMGGYARYVWPAYIIVVAAITLNVIQARRALKRARAAALRRLATKGQPAEGPEVGPPELEKGQ